MQDGEKCGGYTFLARKKNKINRKLTASEARHLAKPQNVVRQLTKTERNKMKIKTLVLFIVSIQLAFSQSKTEYLKNNRFDLLNSKF